MHHHSHRTTQIALKIHTSLYKISTMYSLVCKRYITVVPARSIHSNYLPVHSLFSWYTFGTCISST